MEIDIEDLKAKLDKLPDDHKAALMAPALIYIGRALDEFGQPKAALKVAEAAIILISSMNIRSDQDRIDQQKTIDGLQEIVSKLKKDIGTHKEH